MKGTCCGGELIRILINPALVAIFDGLLNPDELAANILENLALSLLRDFLLAHLLSSLSILAMYLLASSSVLHQSKCLWSALLKT